MRVISFRHGPAGERCPERWPDDSLRPLTPRGEERTHAAASGLACIEPGIRLITASPLVRAMQTADVLVRMFEGATVGALDALSPMGSHHQVLEFLAARIATKRLRCALERCAAVGPPFAPVDESGWIRRRAATREALGRIHDLTTLHDRLARLSGRLAAARPGVAAAFEPVLALIATERGAAVGSFGAGPAALDTIPTQVTDPGRAVGWPRLGADQR
jgi:hypothetical protein